MIIANSALRALLAIYHLIGYPTRARAIINGPSKREQGWKNWRELGKPYKQTKVCIIFENSPNTPANSFAKIDQHDGLTANLIGLDFSHLPKSTAKSGLPCGRIGLVALPVFAGVFCPAFKDPHPGNFEQAYIFVDPLQAIDTSLLDLLL